MTTARFKARGPAPYQDPCEDPRVSRQSWNHVAGVTIGEAVTGGGRWRGRHSLHPRSRHGRKRSREVHKGTTRIPLTASAAIFARCQVAYGPAAKSCPQQLIQYLCNRPGTPQGIRRFAA
jgi:hypothetical protein